MRARRQNGGAPGEVLPTDATEAAEDDAMFARLEDGHGRGVLRARSVDDLALVEEPSGDGAVERRVPSTESGFGLAV